MNHSGLTRSVIAASAFASALCIGSGALAQATVTPGMQVVDQAGSPVGIVTTVSGDELIVRTDRHEVRLPASSFTPNKGKLLFGMSQAQLNAETDKALAAANAAVAVGAEVRGSGGQVAGTIDKLDDATVTLKLVSGELVRLPRSAVAGSEQGVVLGVTIEELKAMAAQAGEAEQTAAVKQ